MPPFVEIIALLFVLAAMLLVAGCEDVMHSHSQDIVIVKLNHDGSTAWIKTIDSGKNYVMNDALQTSDGGYALEGISSTPFCNPQCKGYENWTPTILRFSKTGELISEWRFPSELEEKPGQYLPVGLVQTHDNGFYTISDTGIILFIDQNGTITGTRFPDTDPQKKIQSFIRTRDGGSALTYNAFVEKLDPNGRTSWTGNYSALGFSVVDQIAELDNDRGYASVMTSNANNSVVVIDNNGRIVNSSLINMDTYQYYLQTEPEGFSVFGDRIINSTYPVYRYDNNGIMIDAMRNFTYGPQATIVTSDSGYVSVRKTLDFGTPKAATIISAQKLDRSGEVVWDRQVITSTVDMYSIHTRNMLETSDRGYLIVLGIESKGSLYK